MEKETKQGYIVRGYDFFDFIEDSKDFMPSMSVVRARELKRANIPYLTSYEKFYRPLKEQQFYKATLTLDVTEGIGEPIKRHHFAEFEKNIVEMTDRKLSLLGWIVRDQDYDGTWGNLTFYLEYPGDGKARGWRGPIFGYGMFWHHQLREMLEDSTPANTPKPCRFTIELN